MCTRTYIYKYESIDVSALFVIANKHLRWRNAIYTEQRLIYLKTGSWTFYVHTFKFIVTRYSIITLYAIYRVIYLTKFASITKNLSSVIDPIGRGNTALLDTQRFVRCFENTYFTISISSAIASIIWCVCNWFCIYRDIVLIFVLCVAYIYVLRAQVHSFKTFFTNLHSCW